jgi:pimeloyl-ACP methyl ester carboxylesterase
MSIIESIIFSHHDATFAGTLYKPDTPEPVPVVVVIHAAQGGVRDYPFYQHLIHHLPAAGIGVLLYDRRGAGQSTGNFETADFALLAADAQAAVATLAQRNDIDNQRIGIYGISQGGWIAPLVAARCPQIALLVIASGCGVTPAEQMTFSACTAIKQAGYSDTISNAAQHLRDQVDAYYRGSLPYDLVQAAIDADRHESWFPLTFINPDLPHNIQHSKWFYEMDYEPVDIWQHVDHPTLFLYGTHDKWVPITESIRRYRAATTHISDVTFVQIPEADHFMQDANNPADDEIHGIVNVNYLMQLQTWLVQRFEQRLTRDVTHMD